MAHPNGNRATRLDVTTFCLSPRFAVPRPFGSSSTDSVRRHAVTEKDFWPNHTTGPFLPDPRPILKGRAKPLFAPPVHRTAGTAFAWPVRKTLAGWGGGPLFWPCLPGEGVPKAAFGPAHTARGEVPQS